MDGRISVRSQKGRGTEFIVEVKLGLAAGVHETFAGIVSAGDAGGLDLKTLDFTGRRILLAEDNAINTEVAVMLLQDRGFSVDTAQNGEQALQTYQASALNYYDAILMDIRDAGHGTGLTAAARIRTSPRADAGQIPIIAMTANAFDDDIAKSMAAGMNAHLAKPIDPTY